MLVAALQSREFGRTPDLLQLELVGMSGPTLPSPQCTADYTALFYLGRLVEYAETMSLFENPKQKLTDDYVRGRFG